MIIGHWEVQGLVTLGSDATPPHFPHTHSGPIGGQLWHSFPDNRGYEQGNVSQEKLNMIVI